MIRFERRNVWFTDEWLETDYTGRWRIEDVEGEVSLWIECFELTEKRVYDRTEDVVHKSHHKFLWRSWIKNVALKCTNRVEVYKHYKPIVVYGKYYDTVLHAMKDLNMTRHRVEKLGEFL